jgi:hypothetical protein
MKLTAGMSSGTLCGVYWYIVTYLLHMFMFGGVSYSCVFYYCCHIQDVPDIRHI